MSYNYWMVALSIFVAIMAAYCALLLSLKVTPQHDQKRKYRLLGAAMSMGLGIWSMHFIGMLAMEISIPVTYDALLTVLSALVAIVFSGIALSTACSTQLSPQRTIFVGIIGGLGIASMHYVGMAAMQVSATMEYQPELVALSVFIASGAFITVLKLITWLKVNTSPDVDLYRIGAAVFMGLAIALMHYTGMAATAFNSLDHPVLSATNAYSINKQQLVIIVGLVSTLLLFSISLYASWNKQTGIGISGKVSILSFSLIFFTAIITGTVFYQHTRELLISQVVEKYHEQASLQSIHILALIDTLRHDVKFLANTPPIQGIIRSHQANGIDPLDGSTEILWKQRLASMFDAFLETKTGYLQVRFIGAADEGRELVRVESIKRNIVIVDNDSLQRKGHSDYFQKTLRMRGGEVYLSDVLLNREQGIITQPRTPVMYAATPIYDASGILFGVVVVNMNFKQLLDAFQRQYPDYDNFVINDVGDYLKHKDPKYEFAFEFGEPIRFRDANTDIRDVSLSHLHQLVTTKTSSNNLEEKLFHLHKISFDSSNPQRFIAIVNSTPVSTINHRIEETVNEFVVVILSLMAVATGVGVIFSRIITLPLNRIISATDKLEFNNLGTNLPENSRDEFGQLARSFNLMTNQLATIIQTKDELTNELREYARDLQYQKFALDQHAILSITDKTGKIIYVNDKFCEISQYLAQELIGKDHNIVNSGYHSAPFWAEIWQTIGRGNVWHGVIKNKNKADGYYWVETTIVPFLNEAGKPYQYVSIRTDVTPLITAEQALRDSNRELEHRVQERTAQLQLSKQVIEQDKEAMRLITEGTAQATGIDFVKLLAKNLAFVLDVKYILVALKSKTDKREMATIVIWAGEGYAENFVYDLKDTPCDRVVDKEMCVFSSKVAEYFPQDTPLVDMGVESYIGVPFFSSQGVCFGHLAVLDTKPIVNEEQISSIIKIFAVRTGAELERMQAQQALEKAYQHKSEFLATMSHELRTPLNAIIGFSKTMLKGIDGPVTKDQQESLSYIYDSGVHLLDLVSNILDISKLEAARMELHIETVDMAKLINDAVNTLKGQASAKQLKLEINTMHNLPAIQADSMRIKQILLNLLSNAVKFTDKGKVSLRVAIVTATNKTLPQHIKTKLSQENTYALISIKDTGIGIKTESVAKVFGAFQQLDASTTRKYGGTGLGMAITKQLVEMHGGHIWFESESGTGTTFYVALPTGEIIVNTINRPLKAGNA